MDSRNKTQKKESLKVIPITGRPLKVLIIEDENESSKLIELELSYEGYNVETTKSGKDAQEKIENNRYDLIILDLSTPNLNGLEVIRRVRQEENEVAIIVLTGKDSLSEKVATLDSGADDYLMKPFPTEELLARMRAVLRRKPQNSDGVLEYKDLYLDQFARMAKKGEQALSLRAKEFALLRLFLLYPEQALTREFIFDKVWGYNFIGESNVIEVYVRYLRGKIESEDSGRLIHTVRGVGYILKANHSNSEDILD